MTARILRVVAAVVAPLLTLSPFFHTSALTQPLGHAALFTVSPSPASIGVFAIVLASALAGIGTKTRPAVTMLFVCALIAAFADARFAVLLAVISAPVLAQATAA